MKIKEFFVNFSYFPLKKGQVILPTTTKSFLSKLNSITEKDFDWGQWLNTPGETHKHNYQSEIDGASFKLRRIQNSGYQSSPFTGTIVYGKITESKNHIILKYFAIFNFFTNLIFLMMLIVGLYGAFIFFNSGFRDYSILFMFLCVYIVFLIMFDGIVSDDINFVESIIRSYDIKK